MKLVVEGPPGLIVPDEWIGAWLPERPTRVVTTGFAGIPKCAYNWCVGTRVPHACTTPGDLLVSGDHFLIVWDGVHERSRTLLELCKQLDYSHTEVLLPPGWYWADGTTTPVNL